MNQSKSGSLRSMTCSTSPLNMEQRDLSQTTQHTSGIESITTKVLQIALETPCEDFCLFELAQEIGHLFQADNCVVLSAEDENNLHQLGNWHRTTPDALEQASEKFANLSLQKDHFTNNTSWVKDSSPLHNWISQILHDVAPDSAWLGIATQQWQQINGLIVISRTASLPWTKEERDRLSRMQSILAIALSQIQLQSQARVQNRYQTLLKNLSHEISQGYQPQQLLQNCLTEICKTLKVDQGMVLMLKYFNPLKAKIRENSSVAGTARIEASWNNSKKNAPDQLGISFPLKSSNLCQEAWRKAPSCLCFSKDTPFPDSDSNDPGQAISGSALLIMPLMGKKTSETDLAMVLGFLVLQQDSPRHWLKEELNLVDWVTVQVSTAIIHHQTLNQVQLIVDEKTAQLKSSLDVRDKLSAKMRQHIEQLQQLHQLKDDFMNSMSHELKTPMTSMKMAIKMLRQTHDHPGMRERYLDILEQEWEREYSLIKDLLTLQQLEAGELGLSPQELNLSETITTLTQAFALKCYQERDIKFVSQVSSADLKIYTDSQSLENILNELLSNAGKYSDPHTTIKLSVMSERQLQKDQIIISIANVGAGITAEELPHIFDKFRRGKGVTDRAVPGTGLGLTLVQHLVDHLNGTIEVTSEPLSDDTSTFLTTFMLKLPQIEPSIG